MESSEDNQDTVTEKEVEDQSGDAEGDEGSSGNLGKSAGSVRKLKLKELPSVHKTKKKGESEAELNATPHTWILGGTLGAKTTVLLFRCIALSNPPEDPPANQLHMTYKTVQAETKLLAAVLNSHGFRENYWKVAWSIWNDEDCRNHL